MYYQKLEQRKTSQKQILKKQLFNYYLCALESSYDIDDPRSWKTVCPKCDMARNQTKSLVCYF